MCIRDSLRVVDYKSGKKKFDLANVRMGLDIQMLLYLFALQKEGTEYFGKEIEPAGVLYLPARDEILPAERGISQEALQKEREKLSLIHIYALPSAAEASHHMMGGGA